jgi:hypothetical protein
MPDDLISYEQGFRAAISVTRNSNNPGVLAFDVLSYLVARPHSVQEQHQPGAHMTGQVAQKTAP